MGLVGVSVHLRNSCILRAPCEAVAHYSKKEGRGESHGNFHLTFYFNAKTKKVVGYLSLDSY